MCVISGRPRQDEIEEWKKEPGWALARRERLATISSGRTALQGNDDFLSGKVDAIKKKKKHLNPISPEELIQKQLNSNFRIMEQIRARVDEVVEDPQTAAALKPYYPYGCKRPTFHDEFLPAFNQPHVHLVDTAPDGVKKINEKGIVHNGVQYDLDVLIYTTGFQWMGTGSFNMIVGKGGQTLRDKWGGEGVKTFLGIHNHGFPNLFIMSGPQGGGPIQLHSWSRIPYRLRHLDVDQDARFECWYRRCEERAGSGIRGTLQGSRYSHKSAT